MIEYTKKEPDEITANVASYIAGTRYEDLPEEVVYKAKQHILDSLGAIIAGVQLDAGKLIVEFVRGQAAKEESTVIGADFKASSILASMANGTLGHADEVDDVHLAAAGHAGCVVVPVALALGEREKVGGKAFINAVVLGYDFVCRVGKALDERLLRKNNHSFLGIPTCFGAAAAASWLLNLNKEQVVSALGLVAEQASGLYAWLHEPRHMASAFETGVAARNGVTASLLAQLGFQGPPAIFEGPQNIFDAFSGGQNNSAELTRGLGTEYEIMQTSIKKYPVGAPLQTPLEGLFQIMREHKFQAEDIHEINVTMAQHVAWLIHNRPIHNISLELIMAAGCYYGKLGWQEVHPENKLKDRKVQELKEKVRLIGDPELDKTFPLMRPAIVSVTTKDRKCFSIYIEHVPGSPQIPFTQAQVEEKFLDLTMPVLGVEKAHRLISMVSRLEELTEVGKLGDLMRISREEAS